MKSKYIWLRLGTAFAVMIALLAGIGQLGLRRMRVINETLDDVRGKQSAKLELARRALLLSNDNSRLTMEIFLVKNRALDSLVGVRAENTRQISSLLRQIEDRSESEKERQLLSAVEEKRKPYVDSYLRVIDLLVNKRKHDAAEAIVVKETLPALIRYHAAWNELAEFQKSQMDQAVKQAELNYSKAHRITWWLNVLSVILALAIARLAVYAVSCELERNEERTRVAMEAARVGSWDFDVMKDEHVWSATCKDLLGLPHDCPANFQVLRKSVHPDDWGMMQAAIDASIQKREDYACEFRVMGPDQSGHWRRSSGRAFYDDHGRVTRMSGITIDIDERKQAEQRLHLQAAALEAAANAIVITDSDATILWANDAFTTMTGYSQEEILGKNPRLLKSGAHHEAHYSKLWSTITAGKVWRGEIVNRRKDGTTYTEEMTITPVTQDAKTHFVSIKQDITERKRVQDALAQSEKRYRSLFENMLEGFAHCEMLFDDRDRPIDFIYLAVNTRFEKLTGLKDVVGKRFTEVVSKDEKSQSELLARYGRVARTGEPERFDIELRTLGTWFSISTYGAGYGRFVAIFDNITERKQTEEALLFKNALLLAQTETTIDGMLVVDDSDHIILANQQFGLHFGIPQELLGSCDDLIVRNYVTDKVEEPDAFLQRIKYLNGNREEKSRDELRLKNGKVFDRYSAPLVDSENRHRGRIWYFRDITEHKLSEDRVRFLAYYDALTGLANRELLQDRLTKALSDARRQKDKLALLFLDLDRFKDINDSLGHSAGDLLLQEVAERLKKWGRDQDTVARLGGDEFVLMLTHVKDAPDAAIAAERIMDRMTAEFVVQGHSLNVSCSIGISIFPEHGADCETLIKHADAAMYRSKESGRNNFTFFTAEMNAQVVERLTLESSLRLALGKEELFLMYQPQMDIATGRIIGLEALLRWQHPDLGLVPPDKFIRIAENSGLIVPIGEWVLRTACSQARKWQNDGFPAVPVAVNVSAVQFRQEGFCGLIRRVLHETGLAPQYLALELTESLLLTNAEVTPSVIQELKAIGVTLAIDDFGTGYSSFSYLRQFQVSKLKIDRSFIRDVAVNPDDAAITAAIISMAKSLNLKVIAEGVENEAQMSFLRAHQCDEIQGYYFSRPLAVDQIAAKLRGDHEVHVQAHAAGSQC